MKTLTILMLTALFLAASLATAPAFNRLDPYAPMNATAAQPKTPYNLSEIHPVSKYYNYPCPSCVPDNVLLPNIPPIGVPMRGPHGVPVPVP